MTALLFMVLGMYTSSKAALCKSRPIAAQGEKEKNNVRILCRAELDP